MPRADGYIFDSNLELKDAGLVAADAAWQVAAANLILDVGDGLVEGDVVIDVSAIEIASNDEVYELVIQVSSKSDFADTFESVANLPLGAKEGLLGDVDSLIGRYILPFRNEVNGTVYRYLRGYTDVTGTIATGINFTAFATKR